MSDEERANEHNAARETCSFGHRTRYLILLLGMLCLTSILSNILIFDVTVICMTKRREMPGPWKDEIASGFHNATVPSDLLSAAPEFDWPATIKNILLSAIAVGPLVIVPITVWLLQIMGARKLFALAGAFSALATVFSPLAIKSGFVPFLISRLAQGAGLAACFPVAAKIGVGWATVKHTGFFAAIATGFIQ
uniref:Major facilitator superfamily (MFS) profile domain-containing protein n=1 Tax=Plectus sambesii TaxID=2011161 RepID=A0A914VCK1_9BILA